MASNLPVGPQPETADYRAFYRFVESCKEEMEKQQTGFRQCLMRSAKLHRLCLDKWSELGWDDKEKFYTEEEIEMAQAVGKKPNKKAPKDRSRRVDAGTRRKEDALMPGSITDPPIEMVAEGEYKTEEDPAIAKRSEEDDHLADAIENMEIEESKGEGSGKKSRVVPRAERARAGEGGGGEREKIEEKGLKATRGKSRSKAKLEKVTEDQRDSVEDGPGLKEGRKASNEKVEFMEEDERGDAMEIDDPGEKSVGKSEKGSKRRRKGKMERRVEPDEKGPGEKTTKRGRASAKKPAESEQGEVTEEEMRLVSNLVKDESKSEKALKRGKKSANSTTEPVDGGGDGAVKDLKTRSEEGASSEKSEKVPKRGRRPIKGDNETLDADASKEKDQKKGKKLAEGAADNGDVDKAGKAPKKGKKSSKDSVDQVDDGPEKREKVQRKVRKVCKELIDQVDEVPQGKSRK